MTETQTAPQTPDPSEPPKAQPNRSKRYRLWEDGDYCIYEIAPQGSGLPDGALIPMPDVPHFTESKEAVKFIQNSGEAFLNKQLFILKGYEIIRVEIGQQTVINRKPKIQVGGAAETEASG